MDIPVGSSPDDIKIRKHIIGDFYASWIAKHPEKRIWNRSLNDYIYVKNQSINETKGHASGTYESTVAVLNLTEILQNAIVKEVKIRKQKDKNQKAFSKIVIMKHKNVKLTVGFQKSKGEYVQYCITVPGARMHKK